jgi:hypothetical protein
VTLVIGADEAGYGPNLGPLVVAVTAWHVDAAPDEAGPVLDAALAAAATEAAAAGPAPRWADSKRVYQGGTGFAELERGALIALAAAGDGVPGDWRQLVALVGAGATTAGGAPEAEARHGLHLPLEGGDTARLAAGAALVRAALSARRVGRVAIRCAIVDPGSFNALLAAGHNKSDVLSRTTLDLVARAVRPGEPAVVCCDRHGGRKRYAPLLVRHFGTPLVRVDEETSARSAYTLPDAAVGVEFRVRAEERPPVAVASIVAKYLRELAMHAFNRHWQSLAPGLRPTAGYPVDAARWRADAADAVRRAGVPWERLWRRA